MVLRSLTWGREARPQANICDPSRVEEKRLKLFTALTFGVGLNDIRIESLKMDTR